MEGTDGTHRRTSERALTTGGEILFEESNKLSSCSTNIGQMLETPNGNRDSHQQ